MKSLTFFAGVTLVSVACVGACGGATTTSLGAAGGDSGTSGSSSGTTSSSSGGATLDAGTTSTAKKCDDATPCAADEWCDRGALVCHGKGVCKQRPPQPPELPCKSLVCGCDTLTYCTAEHARAAGVDIGANGDCGFKCGDKTCYALTQYCDHAMGGAPPIDGGINEWFECKTFAAAGCAETRTCACVQANGATKGELCEEPGNHVTVKHLYP